MSAGAKRIRRYIADGLLAASAVAAPVFAARHRTLRPEDVPVILVYTDSERVLESRALGPGVRRYVREIQVAIAIVTSTRGRNDRGEGAADQLDDLAEAVEEWMFARENEPPQDGFSDPPWVQAVLSATRMGVAEESSIPMPPKVLTFDVVYHDTAPKPRPSELENLTGIDVKHDLAPADGQPDATDSIPVPTK
ncbi:MAG: hypothetical protein AAFU73_23000 [Planctomycetota bacterium]